jgi:hypothetical protein
MDMRRRDRSPITALCGLMLLAVLSGCSRASSGEVGERAPWFEDALTLEYVLQDGAESVEVNLADPEGIAVDAQGRLLVTDDYCLKVFDDDGRLLDRIGRKGKGPGEFDAPMRPSAGPTGMITVQDILWEWNEYDPQGEFLRRWNYRSEKPFTDYIKSNGFTFTMLNRVVPLDGTTCLVDLFAFNGALEERYHGREQLVVATEQMLSEIVQYSSRQTIRVDANSSTSVAFQGGLLWAVPGPGRIVYVHTCHDVRWETGPGQENPDWRLTRVDLNDLHTDSFRIPFVPLRIPEACKRREPVYNEFLHRTFEVNPEVKEVLAATEFYPPVKALRSDGELLFAFRFCEQDSAQTTLDEEEVVERWRLVDVIDLRDGRIVARTRFPFIPDVIREGRVWRLFQPQDDYASVQCFRIDDRLYREAVGRGGD